MKSILRTLAFAGIAAIVLSAIGCMPKTMYSHAVYFDVKDGVDQKLIDDQAEDGMELLGKIPSVKWVDSGVRDPNSTGDHNNLTFDIGLHVYFADKAGLDTYLTHPKHLEYVAKYKENWDSVTVYDYTVDMDD